MKEGILYMKRKPIRFVGFVTVFILLCFQITSCRIEHETITFSYEELSKDLEKISYADTSYFDSNGERGEEKIIKVLTEEQKEYVLTKISKIEFETTIYAPELNTLDGYAIVFYYPTYVLYFSDTVILKRCLETYWEGNDGGYFYDISRNSDFLDLLSFVAKSE